MTKIILTLLLALSFTVASGQLFIDLDGKRFNCDSAYTNYEMKFCAGAMLDSSIHLYKMTTNKLNTCLDKLIIEDDEDRKKFLKEDPKQNFDFWTDYRLIKNKLAESNRLFEKHAQIESDIIGEFYGIGRERSVTEMMTLKQFYDDRIKTLQFILGQHCN